MNNVERVFYKELIKIISPSNNNGYQRPLFVRDPKFANKSAVYSFIYDTSSCITGNVFRCLYVGASQSVYQRLYTHFVSLDDKINLTFSGNRLLKMCLSHIIELEPERLSIFLFFCKFHELEKLEQRLIHNFKSVFNKENSLLTSFDIENLTKIESKNSKNKSAALKEAQKVMPLKKPVNLHE